MKHLESETLWAFARGEAPADEATAMQAHLEGCAACRASLEDVRGALEVLEALPEAPEMPAAMARRVGAKLEEALDAQAASGLRAWWAGLFGPRLALAVAGALLAVVAVWGLMRPGAPPEAPIEVAGAPTPPPTPGSQPDAVVTPTPPGPVASEKVRAVVASARRAAVGGRRATRAEALGEGAQVATRAGGSLWLELPDGTQAGLTGATEVVLETLETAALTLQVARGSLAMVVPHREDRVLTVRAGEVEVIDLGTRFLVSREAERVMVAVEEGSVEVKAPGVTRTVEAGEAVAWQHGRLEARAWAMSVPAPRARPEPLVDSPSKLGRDDDDVVAESPAPAEAMSPEGEWAAPPPGVATPPGQPAPALPPPARALPAPALAPTPAVTPPSSRGFDLGDLERRIRDFGSAVHDSLAPLAPRKRREGARAVRRLADAGQCTRSLEAADRWLQDSGRALDTPTLRREVLGQKVRCLHQLNRPAEAADVQAEIDRQ